MEDRRSARPAATLSAARGYVSRSSKSESIFHPSPSRDNDLAFRRVSEAELAALAANGNLCTPKKTVLVKHKVRVTVKGHTKTVTRKVRETLPSSLQMPTAFTAQNGATIHENTPISVTGCASTKKAKKKTHKAK
ncbi:MAG TPA: hypothetical protein VHY18_05335 [Solirubrobacteraceae bacterium]|nr:hypothetical protein [Solirubrobacteraceae bacterium]